jgi:L-histidine N-alpha-methyltransferase
MTRFSATITRHDESVSWRKQFLRDVVRGLARPQKELACKYFYDEFGSALFDEICELDEYYLTRTELSILRQHAADMAAAIGEDCDVIEFGSGSGLKTRLLLDQLQDPRAYLPVDISYEPLQRSAQELAERFPTLRILPVHADFTAELIIPDTGDPPARRVVYFPGSTIGNFSPREAITLLDSMARLVGDGGGLLIGFDLDKDESIIHPAYNDSRGVTAAFNLNLLARINRELDAEFELVSREAQTVRVANDYFRFSVGETIHTECSYKYRRDRFASLTTRAGFTLVKEWTDPLDHFAIQYLIVD